VSREIVFVGGSASRTSRSSHVSQIVAERARHSGFTTRTFSIHDFEAADVLFARVDAPRVKSFVEAVRGAAALVVSTPVYKATYAGGLKALVDLIPPDALQGRPALGIATTKIEAHAPEVERAFRALFAFFRARAVEPLVVLDDELTLESGIGSLSAVARTRVDAAARALLEAVSLLVA